jgi:hypothetical protein
MTKTQITTNISKPLSRVNWFHMLLAVQIITTHYGVSVEITPFQNRLILKLLETLKKAAQRKSRGRCRRTRKRKAIFGGPSK